MRPALAISGVQPPSISGCYFGDVFRRTHTQTMETPRIVLSARVTAALTASLMVGECTALIAQSANPESLTLFPVGRNKFQNQYAWNQLRTQKRTNPVGLVAAFACHSSPYMLVQALVDVVCFSNVSYATIRVCQSIDVRIHIFRLKQEAGRILPNKLRCHL